MDFYDISTWKEHKLGIFSYEVPVSEDLENHIQKALTIGKEIRSHITKKDIQYPLIGVLNSDEKDTMCYIIKNGPKSVRGYDCKTSPTEFGDGRMRTFESLPPEGVPVYKEWRTKESHGHLLDSDLLPTALSEMIQVIKDQETLEL